jgi:SAM-dependent methyltransferase
MPSIKDDRGYNQGFKPSKAMEIRMERRCDYMVSQMDSIKNNIKILEIGCGTGEISFLLSQKLNAEILGTDICLPFIERSKEKYFSPNLRYEVLDFNNPESIDRIIGDKKFDYIVGNGILHHLFYNLDKSLNNINNLLNTNGKIIFLEPNILNPYCFVIFKFPFFRKLAKLEPGEMAFTKNYIKEKLIATKYNPIRIEYKDFLIPGTPSFLISPVIMIGKIIEKIPILNKLSQSIYVTASKI